MFFKEASSIQFNISAWSPVSIGDEGITPFFVFYTVALSLIAVATWELRKKIPLWLIGSILLFWLLSFRAQYFLRVALLFGIFPIVTYFGDLISEFEKVFEEEGFCWQDFNKALDSAYEQGVEAERERVEGVIDELEAIWNKNETVKVFCKELKQKLKELELKEKDNLKEIKQAMDKIKKNKRSVSEKWD